MLVGLKSILTELQDVLLVLQLVGVFLGGIERNNWVFIFAIEYKVLKSFDWIVTLLCFVNLLIRLILFLGLLNIDDLSVYKFVILWILEWLMSLRNIIVVLIDWLIETWKIRLSLFSILLYLIVLGWTFFIISFNSLVSFVRSLFFFCMDLIWVSILFLVVCSFYFSLIIYCHVKIDFKVWV